MYNEFLDAVPTTLLFFQPMNVELMFPLVLCKFMMLHPLLWVVCLDLLPFNVFE